MDQPLFYGWSVMMMVVGTAIVSGTLCWMHGRSYGYREVRWKDREAERKQRQARKNRSREMNLIGQIKNRLLKHNKSYRITPPVCTAMGHLMTVIFSDSRSIEPLVIEVRYEDKIGTVHLAYGGCYRAFLGADDIDVAVQRAISEMDLQLQWGHLAD